ncbi:MAG: hypothetical protein KZQ89_01490 [Candidatus Thiodiazotropha sp. (ex Lucinoma kastoroae)]|nr:hypothetical protein [Candidatus Thiodiazotropha sp. (ex Lucinoma kastoroae)]
MTQPDPYIKHVTTLGDTQQIVSTEDILNDDQAVSELNALVQEMIFLVQSTAREALRRWVKDLKFRGSSVMSCRR